MADPPAEIPAPPYAIEQILGFLRIYRAMLLLAYLGFLGLGLWAALAPGLPEASGPMGWVIAAIGLGFGSLTAYGFTTPRSPWGWKVQAALLCVGIPICVTAPFALVIGWTWLHPGVRAAFGIMPDVPEPEEATPTKATPTRATPTKAEGS